MKVLITGSESFVGKELKKECGNHGIEFIGMDSCESQDSGRLNVDIRAPHLESVIPENLDAIIHLAAISRDSDCRADPHGAFDVNILGTLNLIRAAQLKKTRQFIFASSEWVYGEVQNNSVQNEETVIDANQILSEYVLTKIAGERMGYMAVIQGLPAFTVLRFAIIYGPRPANWSAVEMLFHSVKTQENVEVKGSLKTARRFIHVNDIAKGIISALGRNGFEIFNLSGNELITLSDVIQFSSSLLDRKPQVMEGNPHLTSIRNPDNQKAKRILSWQPLIKLKHGLLTLGME